MINWKVTELLERKPEHKAFVDLMVKESLEDPRRPPPRIPTTEQAPSTVAALAAQALRDPLDDVAWSHRPLPENYLANPDAKNLDELTAKRTLGVEEALLIQDVRHKAQNRVGDQLDTTKLHREAKRKAIDAFVYSKPADLTPEELAKVTKLTPMVSELIEPPQPKKPSLIKKVFGWFERMDSVAAHILHEDKNADSD